MKNNLVLLALLSWIPCVAFANQVPKPLTTDPRIRIVAYDSNNVVSIAGSQLVQTVIQFGDDETITGVESGDSVAWAVSINKTRPNLLFIKPTVDSSDTNMTVVTNQHVYQFHLFITPKETAGSATVTYSIRFTYPEMIKQQLTANWLAKEQWKKSVVTDYPANPLSWNWAYSYSSRCARNLVPIRAFDDGRFTYFQFSQNAEIPAIFVVDSAGNESLANWRMAGQYVVIERLARQFSFRNGRIASCIFNDRYPTL